MTVLDVPVDAVVGDVELAADEPLGEGSVRPVEHLLEVGVPVQPVRLARPEGLPIGICSVIHRRGRVCLRGELLARREHPVLGEQVAESLARVTHCGKTSCVACITLLTTVVASPTYGHRSGCVAPETAVLGRNGGPK